MSVAVTLLPGRSGDALEGRLERYEGEILHAVFPRAYAPGAPIQLRFALPGSPGGDDPASLTVKTVGSKRREDGTFDVRLRPVDLRREVRDALRTALG